MRDCYANGPFVDSHLFGKTLYKPIVGTRDIQVCRFTPCHSRIGSVYRMEVIFDAGRRLPSYCYHHFGILLIILAAKLCDCFEYLAAKVC